MATACPLCRGSRNCPECDGLGAVTCGECDGQGCPACEQLGVRPCLPCDASGVCPRCKGEGEISEAGASPIIYEL
ncbi:MAG TPA: hypothetical protein VFT91_01660 [Dehalococcoidia bacterium]|nr:hypothetical protein [Dehalococcoidia bacterium]